MVYSITGHDTRHVTCVSSELKASQDYKSHQAYMWFKELFCENLMEIAQILAEI